MRDWLIRITATCSVRGYRWLSRVGAKASAVGDFIYCWHVGQHSANFKTHKFPSLNGFSIKGVFVCCRCHLWRQLRARKPEYEAWRSAADVQDDDTAPWCYAHQHEETLWGVPQINPSCVSNPATAAPPAESARASLPQQDFRRTSGTFESEHPCGPLQGNLPYGVAQNRPPLFTLSVPVPPSWRLQPLLPHESLAWAALEPLRSKTYRLSPSCVPPHCCSPAEAVHALSDSRPLRTLPDLFNIINLPQFILGNFPSTSDPWRSLQSWKCSKLRRL